MSSAIDAGKTCEVRSAKVLACQRQAAWLRKRVAPDARAHSWRPRKRHRTAAKH